MGAKHGFNSDPAREVVVLLDVLNGGDVNHGYDADGWKVLVTLNGQPVRSLAGLHAAWRRAEAEGAPFLEFGFGSGVERKIVLEQAAVRESEAELLSLHGIPQRASAGVLAQSARLMRGGSGGPNATGAQVGAAHDVALARAPARPHPPTVALSVSAVAVPAGSKQLQGSATALVGTVVGVRQAEAAPGSQNDGQQHRGAGGKRRGKLRGV